VLPLRDEIERGAELVRACVDAYEAGIGIACDAQLMVAKVVRLEPVRSLAVASANLTRDIGAAQLSAARWFLDP
jgi:hypothetical protein